MEEHKDTAQTSSTPQTGMEERDEPMNMEESLAYVSPEDPRPGEIVEGKVVHLSHDGVLVDIGAKSEGIIHLQDLSHKRVDRATDVVKLGDVIQVYVIGFEGDEGVLKLSKRRADEQAAWSKLEEWLHTGEIIEAPVIDVVKGGIVVDVGLRGFVPASHIARGYVNALDSFLGQTVRLKVIEIDRSKRRAILSRKLAIEEETRARQEVIWNDIQEGQVREGVVKSLSAFGAFVDLGGIDGLLHISEMAWKRIGHPSELLTVGQTISVKVLKADREKEKISLGLRHIQDNPWNSVRDRYEEGRTYRGRVVRLADFGAFVELEPGIDGLIHISQLSYQRVRQPADVVHVGEEILVKVIKVDPEHKRVSLSKRDADPVATGEDAVSELPSDSGAGSER